MDPLSAVIWSAEARRELPARAKDRRLLLDYSAARCCGRNVSVGGLHLRWTAAREPGADEFLPLRAPTDMEAYLQRDLVGVLDTTQGRIAMRGWGPFRRPVVELDDGAVWLATERLARSFGCEVDVAGTAAFLARHGLRPPAGPPPDRR